MKFLTSYHMVIIVNIIMETLGFPGHLMAILDIRHINHLDKLKPKQTCTSTHIKGGAS